MRGKEVALHLHRDGLGSKEPESDGAVGMDLGRGEVVDIKECLLCAGSQGGGKRECDDDAFFHRGVGFRVGGIGGA